MVSDFSKTSTSTTSVGGGGADDSIVDDLEAGTKALLDHPLGGLEADVGTFQPFHGQDSLESHQEERCTLPRLVGSIQIPSRPSRLDSSGSNRSDSTTNRKNDGGVEAGDFAHVDAMLGVFRSLEASFSPFQRQVSNEHRTIEPIAEERGGNDDDEETENEDEEEEDGEGEVKEDGDGDGGDEQQQDRQEPVVPIKDRLIDMFGKIQDLQTSILGTRLCRSCSLERSAENRDLTWDRELGAGTYGRVSLVFHDEGVLAIKELTEVKSYNSVASISKLQLPLSFMKIDTPVVSIHARQISEYCLRYTSITIHPGLRRL